MGWQVVEQPDGLYSIFSSIVDDIICFDCTKEEVIEEFAQAGYESARASAENMMEMRPHRQVMSWDEMTETIHDVHGKKTSLVKMRKANERANN